MQWSDFAHSPPSSVGPCDAPPYGRSVFFRPAGIRVGEELHLARTVPLEPGTQASCLLRFHNPHLAPSAVAGHSLRILAPEQTLRVASPGSFPLCGDLEVPLEVLGGDAELTVQVAPTAALHTSFTTRFVTAPEWVTAELTETVSGAAEILGLYGALRRKARFETADDELDVLADFQRLLPTEYRIAERTGVLLAGRGDEVEATRILRSLDPEELGDEARFVLFLLKRSSTSSPWVFRRRAASRSCWTSWSASTPARSHGSSPRSSSTCRRTSVGS